MSNGTYLGDCVFFDVGQGSANAVILPDRSALVFDAGPRKQSVLHDCLDEFLVKRIECVVLSHNDRDHVAGWEELAKRFAGKIKKVILLEDRDYRDADIFDLTMLLVSQGAIPRPVRAEIEALDESYTIYVDQTENLRVDLLYPDMNANVAAKHEGDPNLTSVIAVLNCNGHCVVFPGDSTARAWRELAKARSDLPLDVDVLAMPHHGGLIDDGGRLSELEWLFSGGVRPRTVVVSAGTTNQHGHPRREYVEWLRNAGIRVICTQITSQCYNGNEEEMNSTGNVLGNLQGL